MKLKKIQSSDNQICFVTPQRSLKWNQEKKGSEKPNLYFLGLIAVSAHQLYQIDFWTFRLEKEKTYKLQKPEEAD